MTGVLSAERGLVQRRAAVLGAGVRVSPVFQQDRDHFRLALLSRPVKWGTAVVGSAGRRLLRSGVNRRASPDQVANRPGMTELGRPVQRRAARPIPGVDVGTVIDQQPCDRRRRSPVQRRIQSLGPAGPNVSPAVDQQRNHVNPAVPGGVVERGLPHPPFRVYVTTVAN